MSAQRYVVMAGVLSLAAFGILLPGERACAQFTTGEAMAGTEGMNTLNGGGSGGGGGSIGVFPIDRARNAANLSRENNAAYNTGLAATGGAMPGAPGGMMPGEPGGAMMPGAPGGAMMPGAPGGGAMPAGVPGAVTGVATVAGGAATAGLTPEQQAQLAARGPMITVISGVRVFDVITGELIDDAVKKKVPEREKDKYFDDGPAGGHGDMVPGDEIYTNVDEKASKRDALGVANQKVKEQLVKSLRVAADYSPMEFYGYMLMSTDQQQPIPRKEAWTLEKDPNGLGQMIVEKPVDRPIEVPKYRQKLKEKDQKVKYDWSLRFLNEYRKKKDDLSSEFYQVYIPLPPQPPSTMPPTGWRPFADPGANVKAQRAAQNPLVMQQLYGQMGQNPGMMGSMGIGGGMRGNNSMGGNSMRGGSMGGSSMRGGGGGGRGRR